MDDRSQSSFDLSRSEMNANLPEEERAATAGQVPCHARNVAGFTCTRPTGHVGEHVAHVVRCKQVVARWRDD
jgi:hypothetical protein